MVILSGKIVIGTRDDTGGVVEGQWRGETFLRKKYGLRGYGCCRGRFEIGPYE
jgi:hypothetical protein